LEKHQYFNALMGVLIARLGPLGEPKLDRICPTAPEGMIPNVTGAFTVRAAQLDESGRQEWRKVIGRVAISAKDSNSTGRNSK
jgi:hypothetical protein